MSIPSVRLKAMSSLAANIFREVPHNFFGVLAGPLRKLYVDALDALEREASQRNQGLDRAEALALVEQVVEQHEDLAGAWPNAPTGATVSAATTAEQSKINFRREFI